MKIQLEDLDDIYLPPLHFYNTDSINYHHRSLHILAIFPKNDFVLSQ